MEIDDTNKGYEESRPDFTTNWLNEKEHFEKLTSEVFHEVEELKSAQKMGLSIFPGKNSE